jgi:hypothetical protein
MIEGSRFDESNSFFSLFRIPMQGEKRSKVRKLYQQPIVLERIGTESSLLQLFREEGICLDISESGFGLSAACELEEGDVVKLFLPVKKVHTKLPVLAEVVWRSRSDGHFRIGLRILQ